MYRPMIAMDGNGAIIWADFDRTENTHLILPISPDREFTPEELSDLARRLDIPQYWFVPGEYLDHYGRDRIGAIFDIEEQSEYRDYVYRTDDLANLGGNRYSKKRNLINQFKREYEDRGRVVVEPVKSDHASECIEFLEKWCEEVDCGVDPEDDLACEKQATINMLTNIDRVDARGILIRVDGVVSGFGIGARLTKEMGALHFEKAFTGIKGLYQFLDRSCARELFQGLTYINKESDMNLPGLAKAKKSYHPVMMVDCFKLTLRE